MTFAYKLPSWHLVVMTTAHSSQNSFGSEMQKEISQREESLIKFFFSFIMKTLLTLALFSHITVSLKEKMIYRWSN